MKILKNVILLAGFASLANLAQAQLTLTPESDKDFKLKFIGRTNFDLGTYFESGTDTISGDAGDNGAMINDTRLGFIANYGKWETKVEVCFTNKAISFRDVYARYKFSPKSMLTIGNVFMPYGIKQTGTNYKFAEDPSVDYTFCSSRKMGINYTYNIDPVNLTAGVYSDGNVDAKALNQGVNYAARAILRPICNDSTIFHIGGAFIHTDSPNAPSYYGIVPTSIETKKVISTGTLNAPNYERFEATLLFIHAKLLLEARFLGASVNIKGTEDNLNLWGTWAQASYQIIGKQQNYNKLTGLPTASSAGTLEVLARFDYLNLDNSVTVGGTEIGKFGKQTDFQIGLNYFFTKHINLKVNYIHVHDEMFDENQDYNVAQARLQFYF